MPVAHRRLQRSFFERHPVRVARALLGQRLVRIHRRRRLAGIIVETEAYLGIPDCAAHSFGGRRTARNESMWGKGGLTYVYFTYGMHHRVNVVAGTAGKPVAVLLRALEPDEGLKIMGKHRTAVRVARKPTDLCAGPAKLCQAMATDRSLDGRDLVSDPTIFIEQVRCKAVASSKIAIAKRIGVDYAGAWGHKPLRFYLKHNPHISRL